MCSMPRSTVSEFSKTPPKRLLRALNSLSEDVLSRFRRRFSSSTSARASAARVFARAAASATRVSSPAMLCSVCAMNSCTSSRRCDELRSSVWYCSRTSAMKVALCAAMVWDAVRKCSFTSFTTLPTVCCMAATEVFASITILCTSARSLSSCAASAFLFCRSETVASSFSKAAFVFFSSPTTLARPVISPQSSSLRALCRSSSPAVRTSTSLLNWLILLLCSSMRLSKWPLWDSCSSCVWFSSVARRSTLRCRWCSVDSFCSRLYLKPSCFCIMISTFSSTDASCFLRCVSERLISSLKLAMVLTCSMALNCPSWTSWRPRVCWPTMFLRPSTSARIMETLWIVGCSRSAITFRSRVSISA
mmetsp:Transcript_11666/g.31851  ORF Transcript_11666/g.31851 Transcript_11666/m.31851 type:complete len:362 (-) Transcript_11666:133-1218(-)